MDNATPAAVNHKGVHEDIANEGTLYKNHAFSIRLPEGDNKANTQALETPAGQAHSWEIEHAGKRGTIRFSLVQFPAKTQYDVVKGYAASRDGVMKATNATLTSEAGETIGGYAGRHVVGSAPLDRIKVRVDAWMVYAPELEAYFELIGAFDETDKEGAAALKAVRESLQITSGWSLK